MDRDTERHGQGHRETWTGTQGDMDRDTGRHGQGHRETWTGTQGDMDRDTGRHGHVTVPQVTTTVNPSRINHYTCK